MWREIRKAESRDRYHSYHYNNMQLIYLPHHCEGEKISFLRGRVRFHMQARSNLLVRRHLHRQYRSYGIAKNSVMNLFVVARCVGVTSASHLLSK